MRNLKKELHLFVIFLLFASKENIQIQLFLWITLFQVPHPSAQCPCAPNFNANLGKFVTVWNSNYWFYFKIFCQKWDQISLDPISSPFNITLKSSSVARLDSFRSCWNMVQLEAEKGKAFLPFQRAGTLNKNVIEEAPDREYIYKWKGLCECSQHQLTNENKVW